MANFNLEYSILISFMSQKIDFLSQSYEMKNMFYISLGFKPGQRKVMFTCIKRNLTKEIKVAQLAGSVAEISAYHHGEVSTG